MERSGNNTLVNGIASGQTFHFNNKDAIPHTGFNFPKKLLHNRPCRNRLTGNNLFIDRPYIIATFFCKIQQNPLMPGESFTFAPGFSLPISTGLTQVDTFKSSIISPRFKICKNGYKNNGRTNVLIVQPLRR